MASAEGDDGGLRVGPHTADDGPEPGAVSAGQGATKVPAPKVPTQEMPLVPTSGAPVGTNAEPLPLISPTSGAPIIRAVARRPPTALPALGGTDGPRDVPHSARATVDRRRAAASAAAASARTTGSAAVPGPGDAGTMLNPAGTVPRPRVPGDAPLPASGTAGSFGGPAGPRAAADRPGSAPSGPPPGGLPPSGPPPPSSGPPSGIAPSGPAPTVSGPAEDGWTTFGPPPRKPGPWRLPTPDRARRPADPGMEARSGADPSGVVARTGDWNAPHHAEPEPIEVSVEPSDHPHGQPRHALPAAATFVDPPTAATAVLAPTSLLPRVVDADLDGRSLPPVLDADSWDDEPPAPVSTLGERRNRLPLRIWLVVGLVLVGLGAAAIIPQLFSPGKDRETATGPFAGMDTDAPPATSGGELIQPASAGGITPSTSTARPAGSTTGGNPAGGPTATTTTGSPLTGTGAPVAPFSLTMGAVDTHSYSSWQRQDGVCGGSVVLVGAWDAPTRPMGSPPGTLTFSNITVPAAGTYNVIITYAITIGGNRSATVTLNGTNLDTGGSFAPACTGSRTISANFTKTTGNSIVFSNSSSTAPSIMRIVISKP